MLHIVLSVSDNGGASRQGDYHKFLPFRPVQADGALRRYCIPRAFEGVYNPQDVMELQAKAGMPIRSPSMCGCAPTILCTCFHQHHADAILIFDGKQPMLSAFTCVHFYLLPLLRVLYSMCGLWHVRSRKSWAKSHCGTWTPPTAEAAKTAPAKRHTDASATACSYPSAGEGTGGVYR